jgi:hypothetical protein
MAADVQSNSFNQPEDSLGMVLSDYNFSLRFYLTPFSVRGEMGMRDRRMRIN